MKNFLFSSEILPPLSEFFCVCIFAWENLSINASQYVLQCLTQERGIPPVPTSLTPSDSFVLMNQMGPPYWFLISNCFTILQQRDKEEDMTFLNRLLSSADPNTSPLLISEESVLLTCVWAENGIALSLVTASVGFTVEGFSPYFTTITRIQHENPGGWKSLVNMLDFFTAMNCFTGKEQRTE